MLRVPSSIHADQFESLKIQDTTFVAYRSDVYPLKNEVFFEEHAVIYVLEGEKRFVSPHQDAHVQRGNVLFIRRGYYLMSESIDRAYRSLVFFFPEKLLKEFVGQNLELFEQKSSPSTEHFSPVLVLEATQGFEKFIESVLPYFASKSPYLNQFLRLKLHELLLHLIELDQSQELKILLLSLYKGQKADLEYLIQNYYLKPLSISELARISGRSLSAFKRDFEQQFHTSPALWIKQKRLEYATFLLENTSKNVSEIAMEIGYESVSHFIKAFKEKYGFTPNSIHRTKNAIV
jgi:AraC family transcriptional regulator, exoenzyme S synthesis regulatory protein ExsA